MEAPFDMVDGTVGSCPGGESRSGEASCPGGESRPGAGTAAERLRLARGLLRRAEERFTGMRAVLPVEAPAAWAWIGVVGRPELGLVAATEAGLRLERLALVPHPGADLVAVTAALLDGLDVVVVAGAPRAGVRAADRQRLAARARQRGAVLMPLGLWPGADVELACTDSRWEGIGAGFGRLRTRRVEVRLRGRGLSHSGRGTALLLPGSGGGVEPVTGHAPPASARPSADTSVPNCCGAPVRDDTSVPNCCRPQGPGRPFAGSGGVGLGIEPVRAAAEVGPAPPTFGPDPARPTGSPVRVWEAV